jgi:lysophospholipase L1-like esterase
MVQIFVMVPPPLVAPFPFQMNATVINDIFPKLMRDIANVMQAPIVDIYSAMGDYKSLTCDGCHPTAQGFAIIANAVAQAITSSQAALTLKQ